MRVKLFSYALILAVSIISYTGIQPAMAADTDSNFSIQVSPSPIVSTVQPGETKTLDVQIRNSGNQAEMLTIQPRKFSVGDDSEDVKLDDADPPEVAGWLHFDAPSFTIQPDQNYTEHVNIKVPADAGFSYSFALVISRQKDPSPTAGARQIRGSLAVFTLLNVDRPGAKRQLEVSKFTVSKHVYEYLPAELSLKFKNTGNTIVQPYGNVFIQRGDDDKQAISTLPINEKRGYILPGSSRTLDTTWDAGFPLKVTTTAANGKLSTSTTYDWSKLSNFRIGKYTAKIVAVYNDGSRDVPITGSVSFWVIPWKIIGISLLIVLVVLFGIGSVIWRLARTAKRQRTKS